MQGCSHVSRCSGPQAQPAENGSSMAPANYFPAASPGSLPITPLEDKPRATTTIETSCLWVHPEAKKQEKMYNNNSEKYFKDLNQTSALPRVMEKAGVGTARGGGMAGTS